MAKWFVIATLLGACSLFGYVGNSKWSKKQSQQNLSIACAVSLTTLSDQLGKQKFVTYGTSHDYVTKQIASLESALKAKKIDQMTFQNQVIQLFSTYAPTSMRTCQTILTPAFERCRVKGSPEICTGEAAKAYSFGLKLVFNDALSLKQQLDLSKVVAFDIETAFQQTRPKLSASEKSDLQNYTAFLQ